MNELTATLEAAAREVSFWTHGVPVCVSAFNQGVERAAARLEGAGEHKLARVVRELKEPEA